MLRICSCIGVHTVGSYWADGTHQRLSDGYRVSALSLYVITAYCGAICISHPHLKARAGGVGSLLSCVLGTLERSLPLKFLARHAQRLAI